MPQGSISLRCCLMRSSAMSATAALPNPSTDPCSGWSKRSPRCMLTQRIHVLQLSLPCWTGPALYERHYIRGSVMLSTEFSP